MAEVDLAALTERIKATIEKAKADDPKLLRQKILALEKQLAVAAQTIKPCGHEEELARLRAENKLQGNVIASLHVFKKSVERRIVSMQQGLTDLQKTIDNQLAGHFLEEAARIRERIDGAVKAGGGKITFASTDPLAASSKKVIDEFNRGRHSLNLMEKTKRPSDLVKETEHVEDMSMNRSREERSWEIARNRDRAFAPKSKDTVTDITNSQRKILNVLAWIQQYGISPVPVGMVAAHAGYSAGGGAFNNILSRLHGSGLIYRAGGGLIELTAAGRAQARPDDHVGANVIESWYHKIGGSKARLLRTLVDIYPEALTKNELAGMLGEAAGGGAFNNKVSAFVRCYGGRLGQLLAGSSVRR